MAVQIRFWRDLALALAIAGAALAQIGDGASSKARPAGASNVRFIKSLYGARDLTNPRTGCEQVMALFQGSARPEQDSGPHHRSKCDHVIDVIAGPAAPDPLEAAKLLMSHPEKLTTDSRQRLIVTDPRVSAVHIFDFAGKKYERISGEPQGQLRQPYGVAADAESRIYVTDPAQGTVLVYSAKGKFQKYLGNAKAERFFDSPAGIAIDRRAGHVYLADAGSHMIFIMDLQGKILSRVGKRGGGNGPAEFRTPVDLAVNDREFVVLDRENPRIQVFDLRGRFRTQFDPHMSDVTGVALDQEDRIYIVTKLGFVQVFDQKGQLLYRFGGMGDSPGQFQEPTGICVDSGDRFFVADAGNRRVQEFQFGGNERASLQPQGTSGVLK
jgi:DNA-binding beta-propeller fold protein YncE